MTAIQHEWQRAEHVGRYLERADRISHRQEGEAELLRQIPRDAQWILDLGTGDGRLVGLVKRTRPEVRVVAIDFSAAMLEAAEARFGDDSSVTLVRHDLRDAWPDLGTFDAVISSFAIHHLPDASKRRLYGEVFEALRPGGLFANLEHVASPSRGKHQRFLAEIGVTPETEDQTNMLTPVETQLEWLRRIGFADVDCDWKWLELALLVGTRPCQDW